MQALITVMFSREKKTPGYWLLSLEDVRPFSAAKATVGRFCLNLSRIMYIRQLLMPIKFVGICNAINQESTHTGAVKTHLCSPSIPKLKASLARYVAEVECHLYRPGECAPSFRNRPEDFHRANGIEHT